MSGRQREADERQHRRERKLIDLCRHVRTSAELDVMLDSDEAMSGDPVLRAAVRSEIQRLVPHLRDL